MTIKIYSPEEERVLHQEFLDKNNKDMSLNFLVNIGLGIIALALMFIVVTAIFGLTSWSIIITITAWLVFVGFSIEKYSITVPALQEWIATDYLKKDPQGKLVPYRTGFHFRIPWHIVDEANKIDLKKQVTVASLNGWGCTSKDGVFFKTEFNLSHCPSEEFGLQYIKWPEAVREITLRTAIEEVLSTEYAKRQGDEIIEEQDKIKEIASNIFGGDGALSELEQALGIRVKGPTISAIKMDEETQKAKSAQFKVKSLADAIRILTEKPDGTTTGMTVEQASRLAPVVMEFITRTEVIYDIKGVENASSIWIGGGGMGGVVSPTIGTTPNKKEKGGKP